MTSNDNAQEIPGTLIQESEFTYIFAPSDSEHLESLGQLHLKSTWKRKRPLHLKSIPLGFMVEGSTTTRNQILTLLWDQGPLSTSDISIRLSGVPQMTIYRRLHEMSKYGDILQVSRGFYSLPHQVDQVKRIHKSERRHFQVKAKKTKKTFPSKSQVPLGFLLHGSDTIGNRVLQTLWEEGPSSSLTIMIRSPAVPSTSISSILSTLVKRDAIVRVRKELYSLPHQVDSAIRIHDARERSPSQTTSISSWKPRMEKDTKPDQDLPFNLIKSTLDVLIQEDLERCGGTCHAVVKRLTRKVTERTGLRFNIKLKRLVIQILEDDSRATLWDLGHSEGEGGKINLSQRVYSLKTDGLSSTTFSKQTSREPSVQERVLEILADEVVLTPKAAAELLQMKRNQVQYALSHLVSTNDLVRVETGFYCLPGNEKSAREQIDTMRNPINIEQIEHVLTEESPLTPGDISRRLQTNYSLVFNALNRFVGEKQIVRIKRGFYCLPDQVELGQHRLSESNPVVKALRENYPQTQLQISELLGKPKSTVGGILRRLAKKGVTVKIRHGQYCLPDQVEDARLRLKDVLKTQAIRRKSQRHPLADTARRVITLLLTSKGMSVLELSRATGVSL